MAESKICSEKVAGVYILETNLSLWERGITSASVIGGGGGIKMKKRKECEEKRGRTKDKGEI
jgi:hypothetical protein